MSLGVVPGTLLCPLAGVCGPDGVHEAAEGALLHSGKTSFGMLKRMRCICRVRLVLPPPSAFTGFRFPRGSDRIGSALVPPLRTSVSRC